MTDERQPDSPDVHGMNEDEREELIYSLLHDFKASIGSITDDQKFAFIAGARAALVTTAVRSCVKENEHEQDHQA